MKRTITFRTLLIATILILGLVYTVGAQSQTYPPLPPPLKGISSGDITSSSAIIWARATGPAEMFVEYDVDPLFPDPKSGGVGAATEETDFTAKVELEHLQSYTTYYYRVCLSRPPAPGERHCKDGMLGQFRTAPDPSMTVPVSFTVGADVGGQKFCRHVEFGYRIFSAIRDLSPDFHIANGDGVYVDLTCPAEGPGGWQNIPGDFAGLADEDVDWTDEVTVREIILAHYRYNWEDPHFQEFQRSIPVYAQWDDHEVIDDFGLLWDYWTPNTIDRPGYPNITRQGLKAFLDYWPIRRNPVEPNRIYRAFQWGTDVEVFLLDERSYRSRNDLADTPENDKTMLGKEQLAWLKEGLLHSTATWKLVFNTVPLSIPTAGLNAPVRGHDGWAKGTDPGLSSVTGFERELLELLSFVDAHDIKNIVWFATDVHHARSIRYSIDADGDGDTLDFHEFITGPLNAGKGMPTTALSLTLNPEPLYEDGGFFNFGYFRVERQSDGQSYFIADVREADPLRPDEFGQVRPGSTVVLIAE